MKNNLSQNLFGLHFANPIMPASGTFGNGPEAHLIYDINQLGAFVTKSVTVQARFGNPLPRICEIESGILNCIGLANYGLEHFCQSIIPFLNKQKTNIIVSVAGNTLENFVELITRITSYECVKAIEINLSCPNIESGTIFLTTEEQFLTLMKACRKLTAKPLIIKLAPSGINIIRLSILAEQCGMNAICLINSERGLKINVTTASFAITQGIGGYSGPGIKAISLRYVYEIYQQIKIPIIGVGGIRTANDVLEYLMAGAALVQIGCHNFTDPWCMPKIIKELQQWLEDSRYQSISEIIGIVNKKK